jgi:branched-chain amino acid transport system ATP-binding protein
MAPILELRGVKAFYGQSEVVHGIDVAVEEGGMTVLLGANGAGKTTTLRAICGMVRSEGEIRFAGQQLERRTTEQIAGLGVAHVPEGRGTFMALSVEENLRLGGYTRAGRPDADMQRMYGYFPILAARRQQQAGSLSGGEQQMLAIARALMMSPRLLVLDEPSFGLAPRIVEEIFNIVDRIRREEHVSVLLVEQNANLALELADHAYPPRNRLRRHLGKRQGACRRSADPPLLSRILTGSPMHELLQQIFSGLAAGAVYASVALALVMIYRAYRPGELRAGRDGDVFHLHRLEPGDRRTAVLGGVSDHAGGFVHRRPGDRAHRSSGRSRTPRCSPRLSSPSG